MHNERCTSGSARGQTKPLVERLTRRVCPTQPYTYLVIRTWDERRKIVPLKYFISNPLENWSMKNRSIIRSIYLYTDYRIDVQKIRKKYEELYEEAEDWDDQTGPTVQVTAIKEETMEVRLLCSSADSSTSWDLHCRLREEMMRYVAELEDGANLSQRRITMMNAHNGKEQFSGSFNGHGHHQEKH